MTPGTGAAARRALSIGIVTRAVPVHRSGGLEHHVRDLAVGLAALGHRVTVLTTRGGGGDGLAQVEGVTVHEIPGSDPGNYNVCFFRDVAGMVRDLVVRIPLDVVVPIDMAGIFIDPRRICVPVIPWIHGTMTSEVSLDHRYFPHLTVSEKVRAIWQYKSRLALWYPFRRMIRRSGALIVDSEFTREELLRLGGRSGGEALRAKISVVPLGIDVDRYPVALPRATETATGGALLRIALIGRLQQHKGLPTALRAAALLRDRGVAFRMTVGGSGDYLAGARQYVEQHDLGEFVKVPGRIPPEELATFFAGHDVFLFPDWTQPAFGLVALEAMYYGLPIVAARVGAVPEVVTSDVGWLYPPRDANALADLLQGLAVDGGGLWEKRAAAARRLPDFTMSAMARRAEEALYRQLDRLR